MVMHLPGNGAKSLNFYLRRLICGSSRPVSLRRWVEAPNLGKMPPMPRHFFAKIRLQGPIPIARSYWGPLERERPGPQASFLTHHRPLG
jgi:hypothetical protein